MHAALLLLLRLRRRARLRRMLVGLKTVRGTFVLVATLGFFAFMLLPHIVMPIILAFSPEGNRINRQVAEAATPLIRLFGPLILLGLATLLVATSWSEAAIYFTPAEVDFLFSAPFSRRDLLNYKLRQSIRNAVLGGTFFAVVFARYASSLPAAWLGCVGTLLFLNAFTLAVTLLGQMVSEQAYTRTRQIILAGVVVLIGLGMVEALPYIDRHNLVANAELFRDSAAGHVLLPAFAVFPRIITAQNFSELALFSAVGLAMAAGLFMLAVSLDVNYLETAQRVSQRVYERLQRRRQGGGGALMATPMLGAQRLRLPRLPWAFGVGPNLWRQGLLLIRRSQGLLWLVAIVVVLGSGLILIGRQAADKLPYFVPLAILGGLMYQSVLAAMQLPAAFRGDLDRMDWLKSLPLHPAAIVWGEISGVVLILSVLQAATLLATWGFYRHSHQIFAAGIALVVPVNLLVFGVENLVFLVFPVRATATTAGDFQFLGKFLLLTMFKFTVVGVGLSIAATGGVIYFIIPNPWLALAGSLLLLLAIDVFIMFLVTLAFVRFDVSLDTPAA
jgi:Putative ABC exporter